MQRRGKLLCCNIHRRPTDPNSNSRGVRLLALAVLAFGALAASAALSRAADPRATVLSVNESTVNFPQVLNYDVQADADQPYNEGGVARASTIVNAALQQNPNARAGQGQVMVLIESEQRGSDASQGGAFLNQYTFANWQYVDRIIDWGGTSEGNIKIPRSGWIDAAHRNGVKIYGNIFLPPTVFGGSVDQVQYLVQQESDGSFPAADRLIDIAETQGFDGYFLNQEVHGVGSAVAEQVGQFMDYVQANSNLEISWYDAQTESGSVGWQEQLNSQNDRFFQHNGQVVSESMFLDFGASVTKLNNSKTVANNLGRSEFDLYAGANLEGGGIAAGAGQLLNSFAGPGGNHRSSLALFRPDNAPWFAANGGTFNVQAMIDEDSKTYVGSTGDPSDTANPVSGTNWRGIAHYVAAKSPLVKDTFMTNFNFGLGKKYAVEGQVSSTGDWNNIGLQDVLPTWRWIVATNDPTPLAAGFDFDNPYHGGSSVRFAGSLDQQTTAPLYLAEIPVHADSKISLAYSTGVVGATSAEVEVSLLGNENNPVYLPVGHAAQAGWNTATIDLSSFAGQTIASLGLRFLDNDQQDYQFNLGRLGVIRGAVDIPAAPTNANSQSVVFESPVVADVRLQWDHSADYSRDQNNGVYNYNVFRQTETGRSFLGGAATNAYFVDGLARENAELTTVLEIEAVGNEFGVSAPEQYKVRWESTAVIVIDRGTGEITLVNPLASATSVDDYSILSPAGSLSPDGWQSLSDQSVPGWQETVVATRQLAETVIGGNFQIASDGELSLGRAYLPRQFAFGVNDENIALEYTSNGSNVPGVVYFVGESRNNLVLEIDPATGQARLQNQSEFAVDIDGYKIESASGSLLPGDGQWNSLDDQDVAGGDWDESNPSANLLAELKPDAATTMTGGLAFDLGTLFQSLAAGGTMDLAFQYLFPGETEFRDGVIVYRTLTPGDFNDDGNVDGLDFLTWQRGSHTASELALWESGFGTQATPNAATVPEGRSLALLAVALGVAAVTRTIRSHKFATA